MVVTLLLVDRDVILFHHEGGVDIGDVESKAARSADINLLWIQIHLFYRIATLLESDPYREPEKNIYLAS